MSYSLTFFFAHLLRRCLPVVFLPSLNLMVSRLFLHFFDRNVDVFTPILFFNFFIIFLFFSLIFLIIYLLICMTLFFSGLIFPWFYWCFLSVVYRRSWSFLFWLYTYCSIVFLIPSFYTIRMCYFFNCALLINFFFSYLSLLH